MRRNPAISARRTPSRAQVSTHRVARATVSKGYFEGGDLCRCTRPTRVGRAWEARAPPPYAEMPALQTRSFFPTHTPYLLLSRPCFRFLRNDVNCHMVSLIRATPESYRPSPSNYTGVEYSHPRLDKPRQVSMPCHGLDPDLNDGGPERDGRGGRALFAAPRIPGPLPSSRTPLLLHGPHEQRREQCQAGSQDTTKNKGATRP